MSLDAAISLRDIAERLAHAMESEHLDARQQYLLTVAALDECLFALQHSADVVEATGGRIVPIAGSVRDGLLTIGALWAR